MSAAIGGDDDADEPPPIAGAHAWGLQSQIFLCELDDLVERRRIVDGDLGQRLPIQLELAFCRPCISWL